MPLITRCAHCHTVFRITAEQLQAHGGQVRCGRCMQVFNGLASLSPDVAMATAPVSTVAPVSAPAPAPTTVESALQQAAEPVVAPEPVVEIAQELGPDPGDAVPVENPAELPGPMPQAVPEPVDDADPDGNPFLQTEVPPRPSALRRALTAGACLLLMAGLAVQAVYFYRGEIAARHGQARQWLDAACGRLGCAVELPQRPKSLLIEASDLQSIDPARPGRIQLTATLRNHAAHDVAYPALDLVLTNANDHTLARRIFLPYEYLGGGRDPRAGIAANAELTVRLGLETGNLGPAGFRLAVLPAP